MVRIYTIALASAALYAASPVVATSVPQSCLLLPSYLTQIVVTLDENTGVPSLLDLSRIPPRSPYFYRFQLI